MGGKGRRARTGSLDVLGVGHLSRLAHKDGWEQVGEDVVEAEVCQAEGRRQGSEDESRGHGGRDRSWTEMEQDRPPRSLVRASSKVELLHFDGVDGNEFLDAVAYRG